MIEYPETVVGWVFGIAAFCVAVPIAILGVYVAVVSVLIILNKLIASLNGESYRVDKSKKYFSDN